MLPLPALLSLAVLAFLSNHTSTLAIAEWASRLPPHFRQALGFTRDSTPHQSTVQRLFARLDPPALAAALQRVFEPVTPGEVPLRGSQGVVLDGKAQRGRLRQSASASPPIHAVSAFCHDLGGVLAQVVVDAQQHEAELSVAPQVFAQLDWRGRVLTGDALYCQHALCRQWWRQVVITCCSSRRTSPRCWLSLSRCFTPLSAEERSRTGVHTVQPVALQTHRTVEKGHGWLEERQIRVTSELAGYSTWPYVARVFEYTRRWTEKGKSKEQVRYGVTSLPATDSDTAPLAARKRGHWQVENGLHYVKGVTMGEDRSQTQVGRGADILAMVRNTALSLLRRAGHRRIAARLRRNSQCPHDAFALLGIELVENA